MRTVPLGELGDIVSGSTPKTHVAKYWNGEIPWITPADLSHQDGIYFHGKPKTITKAGFESCSTTMLPPGSILFSSRAPIGHIAVTSYTVCTNQGFKNIVPNSRLNPVFGYFALKFITPSILAKGRGATFAEVNKEIMEEIQIPYCDLDEQRRISELLERTDHLRRMRRYALQMSDDLLPAVFLRMFGEPVRNERGWPVEQLGDLAQVSTGGTPPSSKQGMFGNFVPFITPGDLDDDTIKATRFLSKAGAECVGTVRPGSALVCCIGATIGKTGIARVHSAFNQQINAIEWGDTVNDAYGVQLMHFFSRIVAARGHSTTLPILKKSAFEEIGVPVPPMLLQMSFAEAAKFHEQLRATHVEALRQADHLFQTLLHKAFAQR